MLQEEINCETTISVREAASNQSLSGGQGFLKCSYNLNVCVCTCNNTLVYFFYSKSLHKTQFVLKCQCQVPTIKQLSHKH
jgi:hypothetical protein